MMRSCTISISIGRPPSEVAAFVSDPANLPQWLTFITGVEKSGGDWFLKTPAGTSRIRFVPANPHGILDHSVQLPDGSEVFVPMRVVANGEGSEVIFTLFQLPSMSDEAFEADGRTVRTDLNKLKSVLERRG